MESNSVGSAYHTGARNWVRRRAPPEPPPAGTSRRSGAASAHATRKSASAAHAALTTAGAGPRARRGTRRDPKRSRAWGEAGRGEMLAREEDHGVSVRVRPAEENAGRPAREGRRRTPAVSAAERRDALQASRPRQAPRAPTRRVGRPAVHDRLARHGSTRARRPARRPEAHRGLAPLRPPDPRRADARASRAMPRPAERRRAVAASSLPRPALALLLRRVDASLTDPPREPANPPRRASPGGLGDVLLESRTDPSPRPSRPSRPRPTTPSTPTSHRRPFPSRRDERPFPRRASPRGPHRHAPRDKVGVGPPGCQPREPLAGPTDVCAFAPGRASPAATAARARRRADGGRGVYGGGTRETRRGARRGVRDAASPALALALAPRLAAPSASTAVSVFPSLSRGAFSSPIPPTSALSSTADAPLPAPRRRGSPVVGTRVGAVDAPRAAPTPRAAASRAVVRRDGQTRPLIPAVAPGIRARRCHARASEPRRAPIVVAAAAVWSAERRVPREPRGRPVGRPDRASPVVGRVVAPSTTALESSPESSPNAFAAFPHRLVPHPRRGSRRPRPRPAVRPRRPEVRRGQRPTSMPPSQRRSARRRRRWTKPSRPPRPRRPRVRRGRSRVARRAGTSSGSRGLGAEPASRAGPARRVLSDDGRGVPGDVRRPGNDALRIRRRLRVGGAGRGRSAARER